MRFVLIGAPDDRGVRIVGGRVGAKKGPEAIRKELFRMKNIPEIQDAGDIRPSLTQEETYQALARVVQKILERGAFPILIGGGHDLSFGGLQGFLKCHPKGGVINIDPHFDCRPKGEDGRCSSGSAFRLLFDEGLLQKGQCANFGYQIERNAEEHYRYLKKKKATLVPEKKCTLSRFRKLTRDLCKNSSALAITFDMDAIHVASAPGVSAINAKGFSPQEALALVEEAAKNKKTKYLDLMEVNPAFDPDGRTARLAALLIYHFVSIRRQGEKKKLD